MSAVRNKIGREEVENQHAAILQALDKLYDISAPPNGTLKPVLSLVLPDEEICVHHNLDRERLRAFLERRGWDLWAFGGEIELFGAMRHVMAARPQRQKWNRTMLSALWWDVGAPESRSA